MLATIACCNKIKDPCPKGVTDAKCVVYKGARLPCTNIETNDKLSDILAKLEDILCESGDNQTFNNWLTRTSDVIQWGGTLVKDTSIDFAGFDVTTSNLVEDDTIPFLWGETSGGIWRKIPASTFATSIEATTLPSLEAINGLNYSFDLPSKHYTIKLGGTLIEDTTIDTNANNLTISNGLVTITRADTLGNYGLIVSNTAVGGVWTALFEADIVEVHVRTSAPALATAYASTIYYDGASLKMAMGYDRPANHAFICDVRNTPLATFEANAVNTAAFYTSTGNWQFGATAADSGFKVTTWGDLLVKTNKITELVRIESTNTSSGEALQIYCEYDPIKIQCLTINGFPDITIYDHLGVLKGAIGLANSANDLYMDKRAGGTISWRIGGTVKMIMDSSGNLGTQGTLALGGVAASAHLTIPGGSASASSAPLKIGSGTVMTTPETGAFEFDGVNLFFTVAGVRKTVTLT